MNKDNVNHPSHYQMPGGIETIDVIKDVLGDDGFIDYCRGNVIKYVCRYKQKNGAEDLQKAVAYTNMMIRTMKAMDCTQMKAAPKEKVLPLPCNGPLYSTWNSGDYLMKCVEECGEMIDAYKALAKAKGAQEITQRKDHLFRECTDVITAVTGFMEKLGCDECHRQDYQTIINLSNIQRDGGKRIAK